MRRGRGGGGGVAHCAFQNVANVFRQNAGKFRQYSDKIRSLLIFGCVFVSVCVICLCVHVCACHLCVYV